MDMFLHKLYVCLYCKLQILMYNMSVSFWYYPVTQRTVIVSAFCWGLIIQFYRNWLNFQKITYSLYELQNLNIDHMHLKFFRFAMHDMKAQIISGSIELEIPSTAFHGIWIFFFFYTFNSVIKSPFSCHHRWCEPSVIFVPFVIGSVTSYVCR